MSWADLLGQPEEHTLPWVGGRSVHGRIRSFQITGDLPPEHGWHRFSGSGGRKVRWVGEGTLDPSWAEGRPVVRGYLVGDRLVPDSVGIHPDVHRVFEQTETVHLVERGLDRFARVAAARGPQGLVYLQQEFPLGPEHEVTTAYEDRLDDVDGIKGVPPALDLAFRFHSWRRELAEERVREAEMWDRILAEQAEEERLRARAEAWVEEQRRLAESSFEHRARAALERSGSELLDIQQFRDATQRVVRFRFRRRRWECVVHEPTLRVIDSGVCLDGHDRNFTLESLPGVIAEAMDTGQLHVYRHVH